MNDEEIIGIFVFLLIAGIIAVAVLYLLTLQNALKKVRPENQEMPPGQVWLMLIPFFNIVWQFIMVGKIADSLAYEFRDQGLDPGEERPGYNVGIAVGVLNCCSWIPILGGFASLGGFVCWIIYWSKIAKYKNMLGEPGSQMAYDQGGYQDQQVF